MSLRPRTSDVTSLPLSSPHAPRGPPATTPLLPPETDLLDFKSLFVSEDLLRGLSSHGYVSPSPIQAQVIPLGRCGLDVIAQAKSGTGKTIVFAVVALEAVRPTTGAAQALILAPTREIAVQIRHVVKEVGEQVAGVECEVFIGGLQVSQDVVKAKKCQVVVGTPGRIKHMIESKALLVDAVRLFIMDEADKLTETGFIETIRSGFYSPS